MEYERNILWQNLDIDILILMIEGEARREQEMTNLDCAHKVLNADLMTT